MQEGAGGCRSGEGVGGGAGGGSAGGCMRGGERRSGEEGEPRLRASLLSTCPYRGESRGGAAEGLRWV